MFARSSDAKKDLLEVLREHGGRLDAARLAFPAAPAPWIDLSTGVNPHPWRGAPRVRDIDSARLPDPLETTKLEAVAAVAFGCPPEHVAAVPGADMALRLLPRLLSAATVAIVMPTYSGHREGWAAVGANVRDISRADISSVTSDVIVVVNPNNPDGSLIAADQLLEIAARQSARGGWLIVDESFIEVAPEYSVAHATHAGLIVLRSFGKFYGLPGHRLGFVIADKSVLSALRTVTGEWPVTVSTLKVAAAAYADTAWQDKMRTRLATDAARLDRLLEKHGFEIVGGASLFRLAAHPAAERMFTGLARAGVLTRPFAYEHAWLRFGLPGPRGWKRLSLALESCV